MAQRDPMATADGVRGSLGASGAAGAGSALIGTVAEWLVDQSLGQNAIEDTFDGTCKHLNSVGVPLARGQLIFVTLHPQISSVALTWRAGEGIGRADFSHSEVENASPQFKRSPFYHILTNNLSLMRRRLAGPAATLDFLALEEFAAEGYTDYLACSVGFVSPASARWTHGTGILVSWATKRPGGFTDDDIADLLRLQRRLAVACKVSIQEQITRNVLQTYLGKGASEQVLEGAIKRGDGSVEHAVIWYSDMRGSTRLAESMPSEDYLAMLNTYFEITAGAVQERGGDILTFIGDAVLAIFPVPRAVPGEACPIRNEALAAATDALARARPVNAERLAKGLPEIRFGIALHVGDVVFGNIGIPERLSFSVIGPATNEAVRLEALTKVLDRPILATRDFASCLPHRFEDLGSHALRGVGQPFEVLAPVLESAD
ncbi:MAG: adenylate/guanylate cyclase domain-containing protein [Alphaproteobacteria bacterium]|nr:adenylate/guanylate cyclase domain-containing protein [Alphaproteobacteria bacterium]MDX5370234.1 adenylate/guanylate cyclase domain-containing protein [Alphaproteobacteria bacterium]MDX5464784.1 adenylate/guanylate cyclase domain-containing protein [Alphaproteobacteria bacterium]